MAGVEFSEDVAAAICARLSEGESLRSICASDGMPAKSSVMRWLDERPAFQDQYARAKEIGAESIADDILDIADDGKNDWMARNGGEDNAGWQFNGEAARRSQIRIDARKWLLAKLAPKKYGDRIDHAHSGALTVTLSREEADL